MSQSTGAAKNIENKNSISSFATAARRGDIAFALAIMAILTVLIVPLPTWALDMALAISITFSVVVLMTALFIEKPLDFSVFPTVLLIATVLRLALNLASTRLILSDGHTGTDAAGEVINAFGDLVMQGSYVIGIIVFAILVLVNFIVITKGSGRIAEVSARFSLDAMPGKQMAIDADLSAGLIDEDEARKRRRTLEDESSFFGSMDGAAKFVRGDAIAGLLITLINIVGGIVIGVSQHDLDLSTAADSYTKLTVGDGLVTQIPALIVSMAAGMLVSKAGVMGPADKAVFGQLGNYPKALGVSSFLMLVLAVMPQIPALPFLLLSFLTGTMAWKIARDQKISVDEKTEKESLEAEEKTAEEPVADLLDLDQIRLELGYALLALINDQKGKRLTNQIRALRRQIAQDMGFVLPAVRIQDNVQLPPNVYAVRVKEIEAGRGELRPDMYLVMDPAGGAITIEGEETHEPTFGLPAKWIGAENQGEAQFRGYTVVDAPTVITTHLTEIIKEHMTDMLSYSETQKLLDDLSEEQQKLVSDLIPGQVTLGALQRILQNMLAERVSIRDLPTILEAVTEAATYTKNVNAITEHVRARLSRQISNANTSEGGYIPLITLGPEWEQKFAESITGQGEDAQLSMPPTMLQEFISLVRQKFEHQGMLGETPALLTSPRIRPYVRSVIERFRPSTVVLSQNEVHAKAKIKTLDQI